MERQSAQPQSEDEFEEDDDTDGLGSVVAEIVVDQPGDNTAADTALAVLDRPGGVGPSSARPSEPVLRARQRSSGSFGLGAGLSQPEFPAAGSQPFGYGLLSQPELRAAGTPLRGLGAGLSQPEFTAAETQPFGDGPLSQPEFRAAGTPLRSSGSFGLGVGLSQPELPAAGTQPFGDGPLFSQLRSDSPRNDGIGAQSGSDPFRDQPGSSMIQLPPALSSLLRPTGSDSADHEFNSKEPQFIEKHMTDVVIFVDRTRDSAGCILHRLASLHSVSEFGFKTLRPLWHWRARTVGVVKTYKTDNERAIVQLAFAAAIRFRKPMMAYALASIGARLTETVRVGVHVYSPLVQYRELGSTFVDNQLRVVAHLTVYTEAQRRVVEQDGDAKTMAMACVQLRAVCPDTIHGHGHERVGECTNENVRSMREMCARLSDLAFADVQIPPPTEVGDVFMRILRTPTEITIEHLDAFVADEDFDNRVDVAGLFATSGHLPMPIGQTYVKKLDSEPIGGGKKTKHIITKTLGDYAPLLFPVWDHW